VSKPPTELFISHSSKNRRFVRKMAAVLRDHGVPVWHSEVNIQGAQQWHDEIGEALDRCDWFVVVGSPPAITSEWVRHETVYAIQDPRYKHHVIPIMYKLCELKKIAWPLQNMQYIDFRANHREAYRKLLKLWGIGLKTP
jgi:hypothetical protein